MIVQSSPDGRRHFVIEQLEHTAMAGRFAAAWGNDAFAPLEPRELMQYVVEHHDQGWDVVDAHIGQNPETGLPYSLVQTPLPQVIKTGCRGPDLNERHHPLCGLVSSMHTYGLYTGRYGLSDKIIVDMIPAEHRPAVDDVLATEQARQERLKSQLADDPEMAPWVEEQRLFHNYKLLQFFDTLCLYFNCTHEAARGRSEFLNVPRAIGEDVTVVVERVDEGVYRVDPFPFASDGVEITCAGRWMEPQPGGADVRALLDALPEEVETVKLVAP
jgi:hypothetical protein